MKEGRNIFLNAYTTCVQTLGLLFGQGNCYILHAVCSYQSHSYVLF